jgi:hypothetical protein
LKSSVKKRVLSVVCLGAFTSVTYAQVRVTVDRNVGNSATPKFKFQHVPSPSKDNVASKSKVSVIVGDTDVNSGNIRTLNDGLLPTDADRPSSNFFFSAGTDGGRIKIELPNAIDVAQVNTYSWHSGSRAPQVYNLFVSDGSDSKFNASPDENTDPASSGWRLITTVDTRPDEGGLGGQYGVSITDASRSLGKIRYLLFDVLPTNIEDPFSNTFFSEIDVVAKP